MNTPTKIVATVLAALALGIIMTQPTPNDGDLDLPSAIQGVEEPPVVMRIGVVVDIVEADNITVQISGAPTLVQASYLFPAYQPLLGDRVVVYRQDSQWLVAGTMSGPINTTILNPSFESGVIGSTPTNWTLSVVSSAGGVPTFTQQLNADIAGKRIARFTVVSAAAGTSSADVFSSLAPARPSQRWTHGFYLVYAYININNLFVVQSGNTTLETFLQFLTIDGTLITETSVGFLYLGSNVIQEVYNRTLTVGGDFFVTSPPETSYARLRIRGTFPMNASSATDIGLDYMILRTPDA